MKKRKARYHGHRFPPEIISFSIWAYHRFALSFRDVEDLLAERGVIVTYDSIRRWCLKFGSRYRRALKRYGNQLGDEWYVDEVFVKINGETHYLWRAVDQDGDVNDILVQRRRNAQAEERFIRKMLKIKARRLANWFPISSAAIGLLCEIFCPTRVPDTSQYANNRAEISHQPTRQPERQMRRFKSRHQAQRFLSLHGQVGNLFRYGRHLLRAANHRLFRERAFDTWTQVTCV